MKHDAQVTLYRRYRQGDLPDIQIEYSSLITPLQGLAQVCNPMFLTDQKQFLQNKFCKAALEDIHLLNLFDFWFELYTGLIQSHYTKMWNVSFIPLKYYSIHILAYHVISGICFIVAWNGCHCQMW